MPGAYRLFLCLLILVSVFSGNVTIGNAATQSTFPIFDEEDPSAFTGGWGWDGFDASSTSATSYSGTYSYAVTIPNGRTNSSEGWTGPLPNTTGANRLVFAYRKSNPNSSMLLYFFVNGYWHLVAEQGIGIDYQGWTIPKSSDTLWHEVVIDLSTETQGYNGDPDVSPTGQLGNFEIAVYNQTPGDTIYFDSIRFETIVDTVQPSVNLTTPTGGATVSGVVTISATATDNVGVSYVKFYVNGVLAFTDTASPYNWTWDTTIDSDGVYALQARAYDAVGNLGSSSIVNVLVNNGFVIGQSFLVYDEQDPLAFTGGWGWDGFQASRSSATAYTGAYSYAVMIPSGRTNASEGWTGPLPDTTGANRLVFAYRKSNPNSSVMLYFFVNGYWHLVVEEGIGLDYQGWKISRVTDTFWHEVVIDLSTEIQGYNGDPDVFPTGQLGNFQIAIYSQTPGDTIYFDSIRFDTLTDIAPPVVSLTTPSDGGTVSGAVAVAATATDNVGVSRVEFYLDGVLTLTDTTSPYSWSWDTVNTSNSYHTLLAKAYDAAGNVGSSAQVQVSANVNNPDITPPTAPSNLTATMISGNEAKIAWTASTDNIGVMDYQVERCQETGCSNFMQVATSIETTYNDTGLMSNTSYSYRVKATDAAGNFSPYSNTATLILDTTPPLVSLTTPTDGTTVSGTLTVAATATDNVGVSHVEFYANGGYTFTDTTSPYNWTWDTANGSDGVYALQARAYDTTGNMGSSTAVTVIVNNGLIVSNTFWVYDEQDPSAFTGGWGWDGFQASRSSATAYSGTYSYAVTIPSGQTNSSEGWTGPLPDTTGANRLVFAYRKSNPNSYMMLYFFVNGYWHMVMEQGIGLEYQGWTIPMTADTDWHEVVIDLSTETQGYNGDPDVAPTGQLGNFEIAVYNQTPGDTIYFDSIRFEKVNNMKVFDEQDPDTFTGGFGIDGFQASRTSGVAYSGSYSYAVTIPNDRTDSSEGWTSPLSDNSTAERFVFAYRKTNPNSTMFINFLVSGVWHQIIEGELPPYYQGWKITKVEDTSWHEIIIDLKSEASSHLSFFYSSPWGQLNGFEIGVKEGNPGDTIYFDSIRFEMPPIQAYASTSSVVQGDSIDFHISTKYSSYNVNIYREGANKELVTSIQGLPGRFYPVPANGYETGFNWPEAFTLEIPSNWKSGVYIAEIVSGQDKANAIFVVKESRPGRTSSILYKLSVNTYQAYNRAGGKSLYESGSSENVYAFKVSLDRPYIYGSGAGDYYAWEVYFIRWLESNGYTVEYVTDVDVHSDPTLLYNYKLLLSVGHDEYWSKEMRDNVEAFISNGGNVAFFSGNTSWFAVRFEDNNRTMVCYKWFYENDPLFGVDNSRVTTWWYDYPVNRPENSMTGVSWRNGGYVNFMGTLPASDGYGGYQVYNSSHWVYQGTGLMEGQEFGQPETIVGYEVDGALFTFEDGVPVVTGEDGTPLNFIILGLSDSETGYGDPGHATMGIYTKPGGGTVFTAATTDWAHGLPTNPHVQQITRNILDTLSH